MCRLIAYLGCRPKALSKVILQTNNGLFYQSRRFNFKKNSLVNSDGFGFGWYEPSLFTPKLFKSVQPLYQHLDFLNLARRTSANCFIGHIRAATVGAVNLNNSHPFSVQNVLFAHNGTIGGFDLIKVKMQALIGPYQAVGETDSEHFFNLLQGLAPNFIKLDGLGFLDLFRLAANQVAQLQLAYDNKFFSRLNIVMTNGQQILATRYVSDLGKRCLSLYYQQTQDGILIASEPLIKNDLTWIRVPVNHAILADLNSGLRIIKI